MRAAVLFLLILTSVSKTRAAEKEQPHWAFQKPRHVIPPQVRNGGWVRTPIDAFVLARLEKEGLTPAPEADRETLLRRVCFVLTGVPPTPEERAQFLSDPAPDAYERLVERLLASPHHGERWAQHWLDVVRFADTNGYEADGFRPHAWRYRDYVVRSFNQDKPYNLFLTEQICGDLLAEKADGQRKSELLIAAGLHRCGPVHLVSGNLDAEVLRQEFLTEITDAVGSVFLGLTMGCARCHDHKFDPLTQKDYYQLQAFFHSSFPREVPIASAEVKAQYAHKVKALNDRLAPLRNELSKLEAPYRARLTEAKRVNLEPEYRQALEIDPRKRTPEQHRLAANAQTLLKVTWDEVLAVLSDKDASRRLALRRQIHYFQAQMPSPLAEAWTLGRGKATPAHVLKRGDVRKQGDLVIPCYPKVLTEEWPIASDQLDRVALARWLTNPDNPLTARVIVNRLWQHHVGRGLVSTPGDFGKRGAAPSHPDLLDWLANELVEDGWSLRRLHGQMLLSSTFRQDSRRRDPLAQRRDPENVLLWRMNRQRLDAEALRDAMLAVSGSLTRRLGGPPVRVPLEPEVYDLIFTEDEPDGLWSVTRDPGEHARRSLYLLHKRNVRLPLLEAFDQPDSLTPCPRRSVSTFAPQALILLNGPLAQEQSRAFAIRLLSEVQLRTPDQLVNQVFELALGRRPRPAERTLAVGFLTSQQEFLQLQQQEKPGTGRQDTLREALADLCLALLNSNEFLYLR
jgi:hypothetical protein